MGLSKDLISRFIRRRGIVREDSVKVNIINLKKAKPCPHCKGVCMECKKQVIGGFTLGKRFLCSECAKKSKRR